MLNNALKVDNWDLHWQELSKDIYFNTPAVKYRWKCIKKLLNFDLSSLASINLIDLGCGTGALLKSFLSGHSAINIKGTDNSSVGLEIAEKLLPNATFFQADLLTSHVEPTSPHYEWATHATCSEVLEHLDDPILFLKNAGKFLRKNGTLVISVPGGPMSSFDHFVGHRKHYTAKILKNELEQAGYTVEKIACAGFPFYNLYRLAFILRGESILNDAKRQENGISPLISTIMACFNLLFKFNLFTSPLGWIILAKATKK